MIYSPSAISYSFLLFVSAFFWTGLVSLSQTRNVMLVAKINSLANESLRYLSARPRLTTNNSTSKHQVEGSSLGTLSCSILPTEEGSSEHTIRKHRMNGGKVDSSVVSVPAVVPVPGLKVAAVRVIGDDTVNG